MCTTLKQGASNLQARKQPKPIHNKNVAFRKKYSILSIKLITHPHKKNPPTTKLFASSRFFCIFAHQSNKIYYSL